MAKTNSGGSSGGSSSNRSFFNLTTVTSCPEDDDILLLGIASTSTVAQISYKDFISCIEVNTSALISPRLYDIRFFAQGSVSNSELLFATPITRNLVHPQNWGTSEAFLASPVSATVGFPILIQEEFETTTTLGTLEFYPTTIRGSFTSKLATSINDNSKLFFYAPDDPQGARDLALCINNTARTSGVSPGGSGSGGTSVNLTSVNASIARAFSSISVNAQDIIQLQASVSQLNFDVSALADRVATVSSLISGVSGIPAILSTQNDVSVLQDQITSINAKISSTSVALETHITSVSNNLAARITSVDSALSNDISVVSVRVDTSVYFVSDATISVSNFYENKTIFSTRTSPVLVHFMGGFSQNGRTVNIIQGTSAGICSITTSPVSVLSRNQRYTSNGKGSVFGIMQLNTSTAIVTGDIT